MGKAQMDLVEELITSLDDSPCSQDDKLKALGEARAHVNRQNADPSLDKWREDRARRGSFAKSTEKKAEANK